MMNDQGLLFLIVTSKGPSLCRFRLFVAMGHSLKDSFKRNELTCRSQASSLQFQAHGDSSSESRGSDAKEKTRKRVTESTQDSPVEQTNVWEAADEF
jgi:hypothetical protein